jgi:hypothetical protein
MFWFAFGNSICAFGGSGIPVLGVHAASPTNSVTGDSFFSRADAKTPVPVGATNTVDGTGVVL